ncbi:hypothetical protein KUTeg_001809 [Tegillarca granosa]|uniref:Uncharacterized protein n=1 Tax=Tegillarca granosa TaxID=220873 RepID=A0ABQ9FU00_TEGGR|nr:hypothetical protein KUTeg_001809 [Tegillarca granosa]
MEKKKKLPVLTDLAKLKFKKKNKNKKENREKILKTYLINFQMIGKYKKIYTLLVCVVGRQRKKKKDGCNHGSMMMIMMIMKCLVIFQTMYISIMLQIRHYITKFDLKKRERRKPVSCYFSLKLNLQYTYCIISISYFFYVMQNYSVNYFLIWYRTGFSDVYLNYGNFMSITIIKIFVF